MTPQEIALELSRLTKDARSLLLFLETCAVDQGGLVDVRHMNGDDKQMAMVWDEQKFIRYGRIAFHNMEKLNRSGANRQYSHWVELSDVAFELASAERKGRAKRMAEKRTWHKAGED